MIEELAKEIYAAMRFERQDTTPEWVEGGNSTAQVEARAAARRVLGVIRPKVPEGRFFEVMDNHVLDAGVNEFGKWTDPTDPGALVGAFAVMIDAMARSDNKRPQETE